MENRPNARDVAREHRVERHLPFSHVLTFLFHNVGDTVVHPLHVTLQEMREETAGINGCTATRGGGHPLPSLLPLTSFLL